MLSPLFLLSLLSSTSAGRGLGAGRRLVARVEARQVLPAGPLARPGVQARLAPGAVDHGLVKKYFLQLYNSALAKAMQEQEEQEKVEGEGEQGEQGEQGDPLRRSTFGQAFSSTMKGKFGGAGQGGQHSGYKSTVELEEAPRGGVQPYAGGVQAFGGGHKHKHHHHKHSHSHTNDHSHAHKHLHEHEEEHKHKAKHQHVHKHEHHHEHNHHHKHKEGHEHEEEHKHAHSHEHAHKGSSWRRSGLGATDQELLLRQAAATPKVTSPPGAVEEEAGPEVEVKQKSQKWEESPPDRFTEYQEIEYDWGA